MRCKLLRDGRTIRRNCTNSHWITLIIFALHRNAVLIMKKFCRDNPTERLGYQKVWPEPYIQFALERLGYQKFKNPSVDNLVWKGLANYKVWEKTNYNIFQGSSTKNCTILPLSELTIFLSLVWPKFPVSRKNTNHKRTHNKLSSLNIFAKLLSKLTSIDGSL